MAGLVLARVLQALPVLLVVGLIAFCLFAFIGDPVTNMLGQNYTEEGRLVLTHQLGLDRPLLVQYGRFMAAVAHGELGVSYRVGRPVWDLFAERLPATFELAAVAALFALAVAIPLGAYAGIHPRALRSRVLMTLSLVGVSVPTFLLGILLVLVFSVQLRWLPSFGARRNSAGRLLDYGAADPLRPGLAGIAGRNAWIVPDLAHHPAPAGRDDGRDAQPSYPVRPAPVACLTAPFMSATRCETRWHPVIPAVGVQLGGIIAFSIVTEQVFQWPGLGLLLILSIQTADIPVMSAYLMAVAVLFLTINLAVDLLQRAIDPRLRTVAS